MNLSEEVQYVMELQELLYQSIRELDSGLCASAKGKELIEKGMNLLMLENLSRETLFPASWEVKP